jgi:hypothetical protein
MQFVRAVIFAAIFAATPALAQQPMPPGANPEFLEHALNALQAQRNRALDEAAAAEAQLSQAQKRIGDMQKQIDELKPKEAPK